MPDEGSEGYGDLGYSRGLIRSSAGHGDYVERVCEGCGSVFKYAPEKGWKRFKDCRRCNRVTSWRVVV